MLYFIGLCYYHEREPSECWKFMQLALCNNPPKDILPDAYASVVHDLLSWVCLELAESAHTVNVLLSLD